MSQQLAINVINYSSTLVTSGCDADVECVRRIQRITGFIAAMVGEGNKKEV